MKHEEFKKFIKTKPELISYVKSGEMSWQKFYEIYDIYGEDNSVWNEYLTTTSSNSSNNTNRSTSYHLEDIIKMAKNIDVNKVQDSLTSLQKTLSLFGEILGSKEVSKTSTYNPRPLYRKFED